MSFPTKPTTNILAPSLENAMPCGLVSCDLIRVASTNTAVEASKAVDSVYSFISSPSLPITNILAPSLENAMPRGPASCDETEKASTKTAVEASKAVDSVYSFMSSPTKPTTNILAPSLENAMPAGTISCDETEKASTKVAVDASKAVDSVYSFMSSPSLPTTNILAPSLENAMPCGEVSCDETEVASTWVAVDASKAVDSAYSFISSPSLPITNILAPSLENAMPCGSLSSDETEVASTKTAVEASKVPTIRLSDVSRTAPGSIVSFRRGQSCDCRAVWRRQGKRDRRAVGSGAKLAGSQGYAARVTA